MKNALTLLFSGVFTVCTFAQDNKVVFVNTGDLYVGQNVSPTNSTLYIGGGYKASGSSRFELDGIATLTGDFHNDNTSGNVFVHNENGTFEFRGSKVQYIRGTADKKTSYIDFPNLMINNLTVVSNEATDTSAVLIKSNIGITTQNLEMKRGRLIIDSDTTQARMSNIAHLLVEKDVKYPANNDGRPKHEKGIIQVNLAAGKNHEQKRLMGFTPPFKRIYADYLFYNFLSRPTNTGLFGDERELIRNPKTPIESGKGYIVGLGIIPMDDPYYTESWDPQWKDAKAEDRFTEKISFARNFAPASFTKYVNEEPAITDEFSGEVLNTAEDVSIDLKEGWNYLGNPYTSPLDMKDFLKVTTSTTDPWGVSRGIPDMEEGTLEARYFVLSQGNGSYDGTKPVNERFKFSVSYLVAQTDGNTIELDDELESTLLAPMQLFLVWKNTPTGTNDKIKLPREFRTHGDVKYLRNVEENEPPKRIDNELLIQTRDSKTEGYDRLCLVFRENARMDSGDAYDCMKIFNNSGGVNQIYTLSEDNMELTTNVLPFTCEKRIMYFKPSAEKQEVFLNAHRLTSLTGLEDVILEDTQTKYSKSLLTNPEYSFISSPDDPANRFVLHFRNTVGIGDGDDDDSDDINMYYINNTLTIQGLINDDIGSIVHIYDINGHMMYQEKIQEIPVTQISKYFPKGAYIVKLAGKRPVVKKIMVD